MELKKIEYNLNLQNAIINQVAESINKQLDEIFIEGLKRKGFEFNDRLKLESFIKSNCKCADRTDVKQRTYYVNDIPFLVYYYEVETNINFDKEVMFQTNYGKYRFL